MKVASEDLSSPGAVAFTTNSPRFLGWSLAATLVLLLFAQLPTVLWQDVTVAKLLVFRFSLPLLTLGIALALFSRYSSRPGGFLGALGTGGGPPLARPPAYIAAGVLFLLWALLGALLSSNRHVSIFGAVFRYEGWLGFAGYFLYFWAARLLRQRGFRLGEGWSLLAAGAVLLVAALAIAQHFWPASSPVKLLALGDWEQRSFGTFGNPLFLALFGCLATPVLLALAMNASSLGTRLFVGSVSVALACATIFTYSRAGWVGLAAGLALFGLLGGGRSRIRWALVVGLLVLSFLLTAGVDSLGREEASPEATVTGRISSTAQGGGSLAARLELYRVSLPLLAERPLIGWGLETYTNEGARVRTKKLIDIEGPRAFADRPHNSLLYMAYGTGLVGLALYLFFLGGAALAGLRNLRAGPRLRWLQAGLLGGLAAYFLAELGSFSVIEATPFAWAALGWVSAKAREEDQAFPSEGDGPAGGTGPATRVGLIVMLTLLIGALALSPWAVGHAVQVARADRLHNLAITGVHDLSQFDDLASREEEAASLDPYNPYIWNTLGTLYIEGEERLGGAGVYYAKAREAFTAGLSHSPLEPTLTVSLSDLEIRAGRPQAAISLLTDYLERDEFLQDAHFNLGLAYTNTGDLEQAASHFEECVRLVPNDAEAYFYLGETYSRLGDEPRAEQAFETAKNLDPKYSAPPPPPPGS